MTAGKVIAMILGLGLITLIIVVIVNVSKSNTTVPNQNMLSTLLGTSVNVSPNGTSITNGHGGGYTYNPATGFSGNTPNPNGTNQYGEPTVNGYTAAQYLNMGYSQSDVDLLFS